MCRLEKRIISLVKPTTDVGNNVILLLFFFKSFTSVKHLFIYRAKNRYYEFEDYSRAFIGKLFKKILQVSLHAIDVGRINFIDVIPFCSWKGKYFSWTLTMALHRGFFLFTLLIIWFSNQYLGCMYIVVTVSPCPRTHLPPHHVKQKVISFGCGHMFSVIYYKITLLSITMLFNSVISNFQLSWISAVCSFP